MSDYGRVTLTHAPDLATAQVVALPGEDAFAVYVYAPGYPAWRARNVTGLELATLPLNIEVDCSAGPWGKNPLALGWDEPFTMKRRPETITLDEYQKWTDETAVYPRAMGEPPTWTNDTPPYINLPLYPALGLAGEAGEFVDKIKKAWRDGEHTLDKPRVKKELGDILWYLARCAKDLGFSLGEIALENQEKLAKRKSAGTLHGKGDDR